MYSHQLSEMMNIKRDNESYNKDVDFSSVLRNLYTKTQDLPYKNAKRTVERSHGSLYLECLKTKWEY